jgi:hypothetical protein
MLEEENVNEENGALGRFGYCSGSTIRQAPRETNRGTILVYVETKERCDSFQLKA